MPMNANANNDDVARKLAAQDLAGRSMTPDREGMATSGDAMDALAKQYDEEHPGVVVEAPVVTAEETPAQKAAAEKATADAKTAADARTQEVKKADDLFKDVPPLPPNASTKSVESFTGVKLRAAQEIARLEGELAKSQKQSQEFEQKTKTAPPELEAANKELAELRAWRAKLDVDADPKFKDFDARVETSRQNIYDLLKESSLVTDKVIEQIKGFGGPDKSDLSKLFEAMKDPTLQRMVETKVLDIKMANSEKTRAIAAAKGNVEQWMRDQQQAKTTEATNRVENTKKELDSFLGSLEWFKSDRVPDAKATDAEKAIITADNALTKQLREELTAAVGDDSPRTKAILLTGLVQLTRLQRVHEGALAALAAKDKELTETKTFLDKVKASSTSRLRESGAPVDGKLPTVKQDIFNTPATSALDALAAQITATRQAQGK